MDTLLNDMNYTSCGKLRLSLIHLSRSDGYSWPCGIFTS